MAIEKTTATEETTEVAIETETAAGTKRATTNKKPWSLMSAHKAVEETGGTRETTRTGNRNLAKIKNTSARSPLFILLLSSRTKSSAYLIPTIQLLSRRKNLNRNQKSRRRKPRSRRSPGNQTSRGSSVRSLTTACSQQTKANKIQSEVKMSF